MVQRVKRISVYALMAGFWLAVLFGCISVSMFIDLQREAHRFTETAAQIHGELASELHGNGDMVKNFAALLEVWGVADRAPVASYTRRVIDANPRIVMLGVVRKFKREVLLANSPKDQSAPAGTRTEGPAEANLVPVHRVLVFAESAAFSLLKEADLDFDNISYLKEAMQRAWQTDEVVVSRSFLLSNRERVHVLLRRMADREGESFALAVCKAPGLAAGRPERMSVTLYEANRWSLGLPSEFVHKKPPSLAGIVAQVVLPTLRFRGRIDGVQPAPVLEVEQPLDWEIFDRDRLNAIFGAAILFLIVIFGLARIFGRDERRILEEGNKLFRMANFDPLTGLPNRQLFANRLDQAIASARRSGQQHALLYLDLDGFKQINDYFGHEIGDKVLQRAARIFQHRVRAMDTVARLGGDEFVILLQDVAGRRGAETVAKNIKMAFRQPSGEYDRIHKALPMLGASVGIAVYPEDGKTGAELLRVADRSMYLDKAVGRNRPSLMPQVGLSNRRRAV